MIKLNEFEKFTALRHKGEMLIGIPTVALIDELRNREGAELQVLDYGESLKATTNGPKLVLTISVDEDDEINDCACRICINKGCAAAECDKDCDYDEKVCYTSDPSGCQEFIDP